MVNDCRQKTTVDSMTASMKREDGTKVPSISSAALRTLLTTGMPLENHIEQAAYSQAMVLRVALGLSCKDASVLIVVNDGIAGAIALATARQLLFAGARIAIFQTRPLEAGSPAASQLNYLKSASPEFFKSIFEVSAQLHSFHAGLIGILSLSKPESSGEAEQLNPILNEAETPMHAVLCPPGINPDDGSKIGAGLICASTFTIGLPLSGVAVSPDPSGRVYCGDVSFPPAEYERLGYTGTSFFTEQPVIQLFFDK